MHTNQFFNQKKLLSYLSLVPTLALVCMSQTLYAEDVSQDEDVDIIVITAQKKEMELLRVTETLYVIDEEELSRKGYAPQLHNVINKVPGVTTYNTGGLSGQTTIRLRGASSSGTQIMKDGVPFNDPSTTQGNANMALSADAGIRTVEVAMGPQSSLYGSKSIGGLVHLVPLTSTEEAAAKIRVGAGSFTTRQTNVQATGPINEQFGYAIGYSDIQSEGVSLKTDDEGGGPTGYEDDAYDKSGLYLRADYRPQEGMLFSLIRDESTAETEFDSFSDPNDEDPVMDIRSEKTQINADIKKSDFMMKLRLAQTSYDRATPNAAFGNKEQDGVETFLSISGFYDVNENITASLGYDARNEEISLTPVTPGPNTEQDATHNGIWAQGSYSADNIETNMSVRSETHSTAKSATTWRIGAASFLSDDTIKVHATAGTAFRAPSLYELNFGVTDADNLEPEESFGAELGFTYFHFENAKVGATLWLTDYTQRIDYSDNGTPFVYTDDVYSNNSAEALVNGLDIFGEYEFESSDITVAANATLQEPDDTSNLDQQLPEMTANLELTWSPRKNIWTSLEIRHIGTRKPTEYASNQDDIDAYTLINLSFGHELNESVLIDVQITNALDEEYLPARGYTGVPRQIIVGVTAEF